MTLRPVVALALTCLSLAALQSPAQARVPRDFVGITSEDVLVGDEGYRNQTLAQQAGIGIGMIRQTFDWSVIERRRGRYELGWYDGYVADAARHGVRILPVIYNPPRFRSGRRGRAVCPPRSSRPMARLLRVLIRRYGPRGSLWRRRRDVPKLPIRAWQIWNEPSLALYWCGHPNPRGYARMLKGAYRAIKRVDRHAEVVTAGLPDSKLHTAIRLQPYLRGFYAAGARRWFSTLAINSYATTTGELSRLLRGVRRLMNRRRDRRARIWITEIGWGDQGPPHRYIVGSQGQATRIEGALRYIRRQRRRLRLRGFVYFAWRDSPPYPPIYKDMWGLHTGLLRLDGSAKPAYGAFARGVAAMR